MHTAEATTSAAAGSLTLMTAQYSGEIVKVHALTEP
jgi:hypothetical protein